MTFKRQNNSIVIFPDARLISGHLVICGHQYDVRGEMPDGDLGNCQRLAANVYRSDGTQAGVLELVATNDPFADMPAFDGVATVGRLSVGVAAWRKSSKRAGKYLSGRVSLTYLEAA
jgi:hypothetical protein